MYSGVAQLVERRPVKASVVGSSPTTGASVHEQRRELLFLLYFALF